MIFVFYILAAVLIYFSFRSFRGGIDYLHYFKKELGRPISDYTPFASIIVPCKGLDQGLRQNLLALMEQDFPGYEVIFVVDNDADPAVPIINDVCGKAAAAKLIVVPQAVNASQKVENLREAVLHVDNEASVFVFVDSDTRPAADWLRRLVEPLADKSVGASTGYRWFISKGRPYRAKCGRSGMRPSPPPSGQTSGVISAGRIHRDTSRRIRTARYAKNGWGRCRMTLCATRALNNANLPIYFVPRALTASVENCTFAELLEFTNRQMKITRVYSPDLWKLSFFGSAVFTIVMITAVFIIATELNSVSGVIATAIFVVVSVFSVGKSRLRLKAVRLALPQYDKQLRKQLIPQCTLWIVAPAIFFITVSPRPFPKPSTGAGSCTKWFRLRKPSSNPNHR